MLEGAGYGSVEIAKNRIPRAPTTATATGCKIPLTSAYMGYAFRGQGQASADAGYFREANVSDESVAGIDLYIATGRVRHGETLETGRVQDGEHFCFLQDSAEPRGVFGASTAHNLTKLLTKPVHHLAVDAPRYLWNRGMSQFH